MAIHVNSNAAYKDFQMLRNDKYFVDKSYNTIKKEHECKIEESTILKMQSIKEPNKN